MGKDTIVLPSKCQELKGSKALAEWVLTLAPEERVVVLMRIDAFLRGDLTRVFILKNGIVEIRIHEPANIFVYFYFDVGQRNFDFLRGISILP